jgi:hypothetical protein
MRNRTFTKEASNMMLVVYAVILLTVILLVRA